MQRTSITVLLPDLPQSAGDHAALVDAACALAAQQECTLNVVQLCGTGHAPAPPVHGTGSVAAIHWRAHHPAATGNDDAAAVLALFDAALSRIDQDDTGTATQRRVCLLAPGPLGDELAASMAARRGGTTLGRCDVLELRGAQVIAHKQAFGGRIAVRSQTDAALCFATLRVQPVAGCPLPARTADVRHIDLEVALPADAGRIVFPHADTLPRLEGARAVVSGGRGIGGPQGFVLLADVAEELDAALGGSLPAVDAGWVPVARQVGQSGKFVAPRVYLAVGISGTLQHLAGVAPTTAIVAVNNDPDAPIFQVAQVGVVADWQALLPALVTALRQGAD